MWTGAAFGPLIVGGVSDESVSCISLSGSKVLICSLERLSSRSGTGRSNSLDRDIQLCFPLQGWNSVFYVFMGACLLSALVSQ